MRFAAFFTALLLLVSCSSKNDKNEPSKVNPFFEELAKVDESITASQAEEALSLLTTISKAESRDNEAVKQRFESVISQVRSGGAKLEEKAHFEYAMWLKFYSVNPKNPNSMKVNMPLSVQHFRKVIQLNPENDKAQSELKEIENIYRSLNREVPAGIAE